MKTATPVTSRTFQRRVELLHATHPTRRLPHATRGYTRREAMLPPDLRRPALLDRPRAGAARRALDAARHPRGVPRPAPLRRLPARPRGRAQRPHRPPRAARRGGRARARALPGAPRALRVPADREGPRPVAGDVALLQCGDRHYATEGPPASSATATAAARSPSACAATAAAPTSSCATSRPCSAPGRVTTARASRRRPAGRGLAAGGPGGGGTRP